MKKCLSIFIVLFILIANILILTSCTETPSENETEITVFAASSMTETLTEIAQIYESENEENIQKITSIKNPKTPKDAYP